MPDLRPAAPPPRAELLRLLRAALGQLETRWRLIAEDLLGAQDPIDLVAIDPEGRVVLLLVGGPGEDLELIARGLAQRAWVEPRLRDWLQLAPSLGVRPEAGVRVVLLCPAFRPAARAAAAGIDGAALDLARYRCVRGDSGLGVLLEWTADEDRPAAARRPELPVPAFRTGLSDADLGVSDEERLEFEAG